MFKLLKKETRKFKKAFFHPTFIYLSLLGTSILLTITFWVHFLEKDINPKMKTFFDSLWWGVSTITTVGYGDITPITPWDERSDSPLCIRAPSSSSPSRGF